MFIRPMWGGGAGGPSYTTSAYSGYQNDGDNFSLTDGVTRNMSDCTFVAAFKYDAGESSPSGTTNIFRANSEGGGSTWWPSFECNVGTGAALSDQECEGGVHLTQEWGLNEGRLLYPYSNKWNLMLFSMDGSAGVSDQYTIALNGDGTTFKYTQQQYDVTRTAFRYHIAGRTWKAGPSDGGATGLNMSIAYIGFHDSVYIDFTSLANREKFVVDGWLVEPDESGWTQWGSQPKVWAADGNLASNAGALGNFTNTGMTLDSSSPTDVL